MLAVHAPALRRSPVDLAASLVSELRSQHPSRFARVDVRVCNGAVALTGSVPTFHAKALAFQSARTVFGNETIIDALEVSERRSFRILQADVA